MIRRWRARRGRVGMVCRGHKRVPTRVFCRSRFDARHSLRHVVRTLLQAADLLNDVERVVHDDVSHSASHFYLLLSRGNEQRCEGGGALLRKSWQLLTPAFLQTVTPCKTSPKPTFRGVGLFSPGRPREPRQTVRLQAPARCQPSLCMPLNRAERRASTY